MRVLHAGNVANNGYINAKLMRRAGVEADALCDEWHIFSQPEWEDAPLEGTFPEYEPLHAAAAAEGWHRPDWVLSPSGWREEFASPPWPIERLLLMASAPALAARHRRLRRQFGSLDDVLDRDLGFFDVVRASVWLNRLSRAVRPVGSLFRSYDIVQANGLHPILALLAAPEHPFVAFEHGTLRDLPFSDSYFGPLLSLAYRRAGKVIITNPDVIRSAKRLGLDNYAFVPHPVDETKYTPGLSGFRAGLAVAEDELLLFSPASHNWDIKGTETMLRAFGELVRRGMPAATLVLTEWGLDLDRSRALIRELGIDERIRWVPPLPKLRLIEAYRGADVVLDQFLIGTFGAIAPEAMACGRPVVMAFDADVHEWCFPVLPPVVAAREVAEVYEHLVRLGEDPDERRRLGLAGRDWVERHHGWRLVVDRQLKIYEDVLEAAPASASS